MPFKQRKQAEKQQRIETRLAKEQRIAASIAEAEKIAEPGEKLMKLEDILRDIQNVISVENGTINNKAIKAGGKTAFGSLGAGVALMAGGIATAVIFPPAAGVGLGIYIASIPAMGASLPAGIGREKAVKKKFAAEAKDHLQNLDELKQSVTDKRDSLIVYIKEHKDEIVRSPFYEKVSELPGLSEEFAGVAAQEIAKYKEAAETAKDLVEATRPRPPRRQPSATVIKSPLRPRRS